ncbi:TPA: hypothetical protein QEM39_005253 [Pseudomonas putida]|jgi:hypothetical protein|uniref:hypothetical protein n=1 Tax=Pseudomonas TaxID=286 RepID=UPI0007611E30|nr:MULTISPECIES: hypothetical protein [Pseudomonas]MDD2151694.1 hypothetical protein [Pseudomonas putida]HDS1683619.1 hypothetical protein [Pseudomonas putida]
MIDNQPVAPLTIIAIFAGIIEASALATLPFLSEKSQTYYTWFLVGFPFFLTALFFLTLNFNYKSFYKPDPAEQKSTPELAGRTDTQESVTMMFSGPDAQKMIQQQVMQAIAQQPTENRELRLCNMELHQCIVLSITRLPEGLSHGH